MLLGLFFLMLIAASLEVLGLGLILVFVSSLANPASVLENPHFLPIGKALQIADAEGLLVWGSLLLIGLFLAKNIYLIGYQHLQARFVYTRFQRIAGELFRAYLHAPYIFHLTQNTAVLVRNVTQETALLVKHVMLSALICAMECVVVIAVLLFLLFVEPLIAMSALVFFGLASFLFFRTVKVRMSKYGAQALEERGEMIRRVSEGLGDVREMMLRGRQEWFVRAFERSTQAYAQAETFDEVIKRSFKPVVETAVVAGMLLVALVLVWQGRGVEAVIPVLTLFGAASFKLLPSCEKLINHYHATQYHARALALVRDDLMQFQQASIQSPRQHEQRLRLTSTLTVDRVDFSYPGSATAAVRNLSFTITAGEAIGLVGPTGGGKTTVADLLIGALEPDSGAIRVDGKDIRGCLAEWQESIGYIPQTIYLADTTIRRNIAFGLDDDAIDEQALAEAVRMAQLDVFVQALPLGLDTLVGERGVRLSGGQRQRIGIARALYHNPDVLIMDEATSALDTKTEAYVIEAIERLKRDRTVVMIAHRLSTVKNCDRLILIRDGAVASTGTYEKVMATL